uniref:Hemolectin-like protein n=1 Tax=Scytodes thoracica TaxID=1112478 RepID=A0A0A0V9P1_SCYTH|nr:hemolectin-like protein [Scytodes thoracica]
MLRNFRSIGLAALCTFMYLHQAVAQSSEEGFCLSPRAPDFASVECASDEDDYDILICRANCFEGFEFPGGTTQDVHKCNELTGNGLQSTTFGVAERLAPLRAKTTVRVREATFACASKISVVIAVPMLSAFAIQSNDIMLPASGNAIIPTLRVHAI